MEWPKIIIKIHKVFLVPLRTQYHNISQLCHKRSWWFIMHQVRCRQPHALPLRHLIILPLNPWNPFGLPTGANRNGMFLCFPDPHLVKCDHSHCWKLQCFQCLQARVNDYATVLLIIILLLLIIIISSIQPEPKRSSCSVPMTPSSFLLIYCS